MGISQRQFGVTADGAVVNEYTMTNKNGVTVSVIEYGATITRIIVPDINGAAVDISLAYDTLAEYEQNDGYIGATCGRYANRISKAMFTLNDKTYQLDPNDGANQLHGGKKGFNAFVWEADIKNDSVVFHRISPDGEEHYPGTLDVYVTYCLTDDNELKMEYFATTDQDTVINLTNHCYFNLSGHGSGAIVDQKMQIFAEQYIPIDGECIPTGEIAKVLDSPFDFREAKLIGLDIGADCEQLRFGRGYDHTFVLSGAPGEGGLRRAACASSPKSGITLEVLTTEPGIQFYSGNFLTKRKGLQNATYDWRGAFCLEAHHYPDSPNRPDFPSVILRPNETFRQSTIYKFGVSR